MTSARAGVAQLEPPAELAPATPAARERDAVGMLTVYLVLLCAVPSNQVLAPLASLGRPAFLWGLLLAFWWLVHRVQDRVGPPWPVWQPVRFMFGVLSVVVLVSFAYALLRGQPSDQVSPAFTSLLRMVSWAGVLLVTMDGIRTRRSLSVLRDRIVLAGVALAILGLVQTATRMQLVDLVPLPGFAASEEGGIQSRGSLVRAAGTATHPLEYAMFLTMAFALALGKVSHRPLRGSGRAVVGRWFPVGVIGAALFASASRSALLAWVAVAVTMLPGMPRRTRAYSVAGAGVLGLAVVVAVPGLARTMLEMFTGASEDPSALSRTNALARAPGFISASPLVGTGFGTFLSRYQIFDNEWVHLTVELGVLGILAFAGLLAAGVWSAYAARRDLRTDDVVAGGQALMAAVAGGALCFLGFDGLAFPIAAGGLFLVLGMCGALRAIARTERQGLAR
ncbi:O-antigen ligase family protein [Xylanimonas sp. McL0601]|uniref:O-antigen ligase family protein n=1 Tax=Xylanimonas sp. McL0601 TaxID=3414739 RepID=UPI003CECA572